MISYDFLNLSPYEFEMLSRDLLQKYLNIKLIESFTDGADGGIDLRHIPHNGKELTIQCKRYKNYSALKSSLKKEAIKVQKLNPSRYIFTTTVALTPANKKWILDEFKPYIQNTVDILGKEDLNNLLAQHKDIERQYFKLWLSSTNVLNTIVHRDVNHSEFFLESMQEKIKFYVQNDSFSEASQLLKNEKYVIISGIPGIGKTTLAEMLIFDLLAQGVDEFVYLSDSIKDGAKVFDKEKSQIFLYDDFLGSNFLEDSLDKKEDSLIIQFIGKIKKSKNKYLIFTTREYILQQAQQKFEKLDREDFVKCIIDLSKYTKKVKAEIFYNHLFFNGVPCEYVKEIIKQKLLFSIIDHQNYNPRIIETFTKQKIWENCDKENFPNQVIELFNNPESVWQHAFENNISDYARVVMYVFLVNNQHTSYDELFDVVMNFSEKFGRRYNVNLNGLNFKKALKELENTFITITKSTYNDKQIISFQNPSIQDFLVNHVDKQEYLKEDLIQNTKYMDLTLSKFSQESNHKLTLTPHLFEVLSSKIILGFDRLEFIKSSSQRNENKFNIDLQKINIINKHIKVIDSKDIKELIVSKLNHILENSDKVKYEIDLYFKLIKVYFKFLKFDLKIFLNHSISTYMIKNYQVLFELASFREVNPQIYDEVIGENDYLLDDIVSNIINDICQDSDEDNYEESIDMLENIKEIFKIDTYDEKEELKEKYERNNDEPDDDYEPTQSSSNEYNENNQIIEMFDSYK